MNARNDVIFNGKYLVDPFNTCKRTTSIQLRYSFQAMKEDIQETKGSSNNLNDLKIKMNGRFVIFCDAAFSNNEGKSAYFLARLYILIAFLLLQVLSKERDASMQRKLKRMRSSMP